MRTNGYVEPTDEIQEEITAVVNPARGCACKNSKCLKLYCMCFRAQVDCDPDVCGCTDCKNNSAYEQDRDLKRALITQARPDAFATKVLSSDLHITHVRGCRCKRNQCKSKYCVCKSAGVACSNLCECINCNN
jgi:hypothetical protein